MTLEYEMQNNGVILTKNYDYLTADNDIVLLISGDRYLQASGSHFKCATKLISTREVKVQAIASQYPNTVNT